MEHFEDANVLDLTTADYIEVEPSPPDRASRWSGIGVAFAAALWVVNLGFVTMIMLPQQSEQVPGSVTEACEEFKVRQNAYFLPPIDSLVRSSDNPGALSVTAANLDILADDLKVIDPRLTGLVGAIRDSASSLDQASAAIQGEVPSLALIHLERAANQLDVISEDPAIGVCFSPVAAT